MITKTLLSILLLAVVSSQALQVAVTEEYATSSCSSSKVSAVPTYVDSACNQDVTVSTKADCAAGTLSTFPTPNCTGTPSVRSFDCVDGVGVSVATSLFCQDIPASSLIKFEAGTSCGANNEVVDVQITGIQPLDCTVRSASTSSKGEKLDNGTVILTQYQSTTCTGTVSTVQTAELDKCVNGVKISLMSASTTISLSAITLAVLGMVMAMTTTA